MYLLPTGSLWSICSSLHMNDQQAHCCQTLESNQAPSQLLVSVRLRISHGVHYQLVRRFFFRDYFRVSLHWGLLFSHLVCGIRVRVCHSFHCEVIFVAWVVNPPSSFGPFFVCSNFSASTLQPTTFARPPLVHSFNTVWMHSLWSKVVHSSVHRIVYFSSVDLSRFVVWCPKSVNPGIISNSRTFWPPR